MRTLQDIQMEYTQLCLKLGELQIRKDEVAAAFANEEQSQKTRIMELKKEYAQVEELNKKVEEATKAKEAAQVSTETPAS